MTGKLIISHTKNIIPIAVALTLIGCGGGGGGGGSDDSSGESSTTYTISGYVLDGNVSSARVCLDINGDNQCTSDDITTSTDSNGYYELSYSQSSYLSSYELISDVRYLETTDTDYSSGAPDYDYVLKAFSQNNGGSVVISPMSTYMKYLSSYTESSEDDIVDSTLSTISYYEQYSYASTTLTEYQYKQTLLGNFIDSENNADEAIAGFSTRLHNINEVIARKMQESQAAWEDNFNNGDISIDDNSWANISTTVVANANATVFQGFDAIVEEVTSYDFRDFDAETVSSQLAVQLPTDASIQALLDYIEALEDIDTEFSGTTYRHSFTDSYDTSSVYYGYYVFGSEGYSYYLQNEDLCVYASSPSVPTDSSTISEILDYVDEVYEDSDYFTNYTKFTQVSAPPSNCSSIYDSLQDTLSDNNMETATSVADDSTKTTVVGFRGTDYSAGIESAKTSVLRASSSTKPIASLSGSNFGTGTLNSCSSGGVMNSCKFSSK